MYNTLIIGAGVMVAVLVLALIHQFMATFGAWQGTIRIATSQANLSAAPSTIKHTDFSLEQQNNIKKLFTGGQRQGYDLKETLIDYTSSIAKEYEDFATLATRAGVGSTGAMTKYWMGIYPEGYTSGKRRIEFEFMFNTWKISIQSGEVDKEDVTIIINGSVDTGTLP